MSGGECLVGCRGGIVHQDGLPAATLSCALLRDVVGLSLEGLKVYLATK
jgi:hypothetical protein